MADFGGTARRNAVAFSVNNKGYVGTGFDGNYLKDFWAYDPATGSWQKAASYAGDKRIGAVSFVIRLTSPAGGEPQPELRIAKWEFGG